MSNTLEITEKNHQALLSRMQHVGLGTLDIDRSLRKGFPEVIFSEGKKTLDMIHLLRELSKQDVAIATRVSRLQAKALRVAFTEGEWHADARVFVVNPTARERNSFSTRIAVVSAGLSDLAVAEETACLLVSAGYCIEKIYDVGISALQRLFAQIDKLLHCDVVIAVAGMDGALPAVIAGLIPQPVIALPTSVGYGVAKHGRAALQTMLFSCSPGLAVVNIDNGYGAAMMAHAICSRIHHGKTTTK